MIVLTMIALHIGAGYHSPANDVDNKKLIRDALLSGCTYMKTNDALSTLEHVIRILESSPLTNTGRGSNLNINGKVSCDASVMIYPPLNKSRYAAIALAETLHPISASIALLKSETFTNHRVKPLLVAGMQGLENFISNSDKGECITDNQHDKYKKYIAQLESNEKTQKDISHDDILNDTVGAIIVDPNGIRVAGVSSGGIWLKHPGRIGHSAHYGAGVFVNENSVACCTGTGEVLIESLFALHLTQCQSPEEIKALMIQATLVDQSSTDDYETEKSIGFIGYLNEMLWFGFNSDSMGIGYIKLADGIPRSYIHRKGVKEFSIQGVQID